jgi:hypothetical protein
MKKYILPTYVGILPTSIALKISESLHYGVGFGYLGATGKNRL